MMLDIRRAQDTRQSRETLGCNTVLREHGWVRRRRETKKEEEEEEGGGGLVGKDIR